MWTPDPYPGTQELAASCPWRASLAHPDEDVWVYAGIAGYFGICR
jgi:hypothetical protein